MYPKCSVFQKLLWESTKNIFHILKTLYTQIPSLLIPPLPRCTHAVMWHSPYLYKYLLKLLSYSSYNTSKAPASGFTGCTAWRITFPYSSNYKEKKKQKTDKRNTHCFKAFIILNIALGFLGPSCIFWECLGLAIEQIKCYHPKLKTGPMVPSSPSVIRIRSDTSEIILRITNCSGKYYILITPLHSHVKTSLEPRNQA